MKTWVIKGRITTLGSSVSAVNDGGRMYDYVKILDEETGSTYHFKKVVATEMIESYLRVGNEGQYVIADYSPIFSGERFKCMVGFKTTDNKVVIDGPLKGKLGSWYVGQVIMQAVIFLTAFVVIFLLPRFLFGMKSTGLEGYIILFIFLNFIYDFSVRRFIVINQVKKTAREKSFDAGSASKDIIV
jgi:hypothetical protein